MPVRTRITALLMALAASLALAVPASAGAAQRLPANKILLIAQGSALASVISIDEVPFGWSTSARQAELVAEHTQTMQQLHRSLHPLKVVPFVWRALHPYWYIEFGYRGKLVADAAISPSGNVIGVWTGRQADAPYTHGGWSWILDSALVLVPGCLLFMLAFIDPRRLWRMATLDGLAILGFLVSYLLLAHAHLESSVWLAYPPLVYLLFRLLRLGFGRGGGSGRIAPLLSTRTLLVGLPLLLGARVVLSLVGHQEIDVGYESVIGAYRILHHLPIYYSDPNHGDTYGPITYLAYVPFQLLFPWANSLSNLHAADAAAIVWDLATVIGLVLLGRRLRAGSDGTRLGLVLAWAWAACPFTTIGLIVHTNDALIAMLTVYALLAATTPVVSGALLGLAAAAKFSPAGLLPVLAAPRQRGLKGTLVLTGAFVAVAFGAIFAWLPPQGFSFFWQRTIHFQLVRLDIFSPWALHPSLHPIQVGLEVLALGLMAVVAFVPRQRSLWRMCTLAGAVTLAIQLPATHWFYYYILWFLPLALVAMLAREAVQPAGAAEASRAEPAADDGPREPALAGA